MVSLGDAGRVLGVDRLVVLATMNGLSTRTEDGTPGVALLRGADDQPAFGIDRVDADTATAWARANGEGFTAFELWFGETKALFMIRDHAPPLVVHHWPRSAELIGSKA